MNFTRDTSALSGASTLPLLTIFKAFFFFFVLFSHPVDPRPSPKSDRITLIFIEPHTGEAAKADYQRRDYALESFLTRSPAAF